MIRGKRLVATAALLSVLMLGGAAVSCGGGPSDKDPTPVLTPKITPASGGAATKPAGSPTAGATTAATSAATTAATSGATPAATSTSGGGGETKLQIAAVNILFDKSSLTASAGKVTIELDNKDGGVPHNIHVFKGKDASGESVGMSPLNAGPIKDTLEITVEKGEYFYQCDVHPTTMTGTLTVS